MSQNVKIITDILEYRYCEFDSSTFQTVMETKYF